MACCIFAAFLVTQLLAALEALGLRSSGGARDRRSAEQQWRLGDPAPAAAVRAGRRDFGGEDYTLPRWGTAILVFAELVLLCAVAFWLFDWGGASAMAAELNALSKVRSLADILAVCGF